LPSSPAHCELPLPCALLIILEPTLSPCHPRYGPSVNSRLDSLASNDARLTSLSNTIQTSMQEGIDSISDKINCLATYCQEQSYAVVARLPPLKGNNGQNNEATGSETTTPSNVEDMECQFLDTLHGEFNTLPPDDNDDDEDSNDALMSIPNDGSDADNPSVTTTTPKNTDHSNQTMEEWQRTNTLESDMVQSSSSQPTKPPAMSPPRIISDSNIATSRKNTNRHKQICIQCMLGHPANNHYIRGILKKGGECTIAKNYIPDGFNVMEIDALEYVRQIRRYHWHTLHM
jgi:hypothetical protein